MKTIKLSFIFILFIIVFFLLVNWGKVVGWVENKSSLQKKIELVELKEENIDLKEDDFNNEPVILGRDQLRKEILEAVNDRKFNNIQSHSGWKKHLSSDERNAIGSLYWGISNPYTQAQKAKLYILLAGKQFKSIDEIVAFKTTIEKKLFTDRVQLRQEILEAVNDRKFNNIQSHSGWKKHLSFDERNAIESLYWGISNPYTQAQKAKLYILLAGKQFNSIDEIVEFKTKIEEKVIKI